MEDIKATRKIPFSRLNSGILGKDISWGGKNNQSFARVLSTIYKHKYENMSFSRQASRISDKVYMFSNQAYPITFVYPHGFCISLENITKPKSGEDLFLEVKFSPDVSLDMYVTDPSRRVHYAIADSTFTGDSIGYEANPSAANRHLHYYLKVEVKVLNNELHNEECTTYESVTHPGSYADCVEAA